jgi:hypothetical protein
MQCPRCQHENPAGQKFCGECGTVRGQADGPGKYGTPESYTPKHLVDRAVLADGLDTSRDCDRRKDKDEKDRHDNRARAATKNGQVWCWANPCWPPKRQSSVGAPTVRRSGRSRQG